MRPWNWKLSFCWKNIIFNADVLVWFIAVIPRSSWEP